MVKRGPEFSDERWTREAVTARQTTGQARLEKVCLPMYVKYLASVASAATIAEAAATGAAGGAGGAGVGDGSAAAGVSALRVYLDGLVVNGKGAVTLRGECQRRGLKVSGKKSEVVDRVEAHAIANRDGFRDATTGGFLADGKPVGYVGEIPVAAAPLGAAGV